MKSLDFDDHPFRPQAPGHACAACGSRDTWLDELPQPDGSARWTCSDTDFCRERREGGR